MQSRDAAAIQTIVEQQLAAFARGDVVGAYVDTAPTVQHKFPTADAFNAMARNNYAPLFNVERDTFSSVRGAAATATQAETWSQSVEIATRNGERWSAIYGLERQPDGSIAITSCVLIHRPNTSS